MESSSGSSTPPSDKRKSCWACLRRRITCDATRPTCRKCIVAGLVCPGYANKRPLRWLSPGRVISRKSNKKVSPAGGSASATRLPKRRDVDRSGNLVSSRGSSTYAKGSPGAAVARAVTELQVTPHTPGFLPGSIHDIKPDSDAGDIVNAVQYCMAASSRRFLSHKPNKPNHESSR